MQWQPVDRVCYGTEGSALLRFKSKDQLGFGMAIQIILELLNGVPHVLFHSNSTVACSVRLYVYFHSVLHHHAEARLKPGHHFGLKRCAGYAGGSAAEGERLGGCGTVAGETRRPQAAQPCCYTTDQQPDRHVTPSLTFLTSLFCGEHCISLA